MSLLPHPAAGAATPLVSLTAVVFDTETTSLDVQKGRVIEIGAVAIVNGVLVPEMRFQQYINPNEAIPPASMAIHHINDAMVTDAPDFASVFRSFRSFSADHLLLGYALDFDLAILKAEQERASLPWSVPRNLCVRSLVRFLRPPLPDYSLDAVANWLGLEAKDRHSSVGDSLLTAAIFNALLPRLRARNIRTLAEAIAACQAQNEGADTNSLSGLSSADVMARADSYPYRHRVRDVMSKPPIKIEDNVKVGVALNQLVTEKISSLFVRRSREWGILTERDLLRGLLSDGASVLNRAAGSLATFPLATVAESDRIYVAIGRMSQKHIRHLGVVNAAGELTGALSQRDLLRVRSEKALALSQSMSEAATLPELAQVWRGLSTAARALMQEDVDPRDIASIISSEVCSLTARAARMAEAEMAASRPLGLDYAVMVLGSGGRGESLLALDQDNAIIFQGGEAEQTWLLAMARRMNAILDEVGVPLCKGKVMAMYPAWCQSDSGWRRQVAGWMSKADPQDVMNADILFDFQAVHGNAGLAEDFRNDSIAAVSQNESFLKLLSIAAVQAPSTLGWFGRFATDEKGRIDLKRSGIMPIFTAARVAALHNRIHERSTKDRLLALRGRPDYPQKSIESLLEAHGMLLGIILNQQLADIEQGIPPGNTVDPNMLSARERDRLKWALEQVKSVRDILGDPV